MILFVFEGDDREGQYHLLLRQLGTSEAYERQ
jgi:hypothetical protein